MASMKVNKKTVSRWGIYDIKKKIDKNNFLIKNVIEKPSIKSAHHQIMLLLEDTYYLKLYF